MKTNNKTTKQSFVLFQAAKGAVRTHHGEPHHSVLIILNLTIPRSSRKKQ